MGLVEELNEVCFERLRLCEQFMRFELELDSHLAAIRENISRARFHARDADPRAVLDSCELVPTVCISTNGLTYEIDEQEDETEVGETPSELRHRKQAGTVEDVDNDTSTTKKEDVSKSSKRRVRTLLEQGLKWLQPAFRPFGALEPQTARVARKEADEALRTVVAIASLRAQLRRLDEQLKEKIEAATSDTDVLDSLKNLKLTSCKSK